MAHSGTPPSGNRTPPTVASSSSYHDTSATPHPRVESSRRESAEGEGSNEQSPLLTAATEEAGVGDEDQLRALMPLAEDWAAGKKESKTGWYLFFLTLGGLGLQMGWSVEMSNGSPFLISLGLSKAMLALVWIAGPLTGVLVQPYVGLKSDRSRSKWGRRKPYITGGAAATVVSLLTLAWSRQIVGGFLGLFGADPASQGVRVSIMVFAVILVYVLDFSINVLQAALRALVVDCAPTHQQGTANAWVSRTSGIGNILGMLCGFIDLHKLFPFLGNTQFRVLCAVSSLSIAITAYITCHAVTERDPTLGEDPTLEGYIETERSVLSELKDIFQYFLHLPPQISKVCTAQFMAWMGWFPFLFYSTTYIGGIYAEPYFRENPNMSGGEIDILWERATRVGTLSLLIFAIITFISSIVLPFIVTSPYEDSKATKTPVTSIAPTPLGSFSRSNSNAHRFWTITCTSSRTGLTNTCSNIFSRMEIRSLTFRWLWIYSHILYTICMWLTFLVNSIALATILIGLVGISWAVTQWVPYALISAEISKRDDIRQGLLRSGSGADAGEDDSAHRAGVVLGIHNVAISSPQVIATIISSVIFKLLQKPRGSPGDESVVWCLRFGGLCTILAAYLTLRIDEENVSPAVRENRLIRSNSVSV